MRAAIVGLALALTACGNPTGPSPVMTTLDVVAWNNKHQPVPGLPVTLLVGCQADEGGLFHGCQPYGSRPRQTTAADGSVAWTVESGKVYFMGADDRIYFGTARLGGPARWFAVLTHRL